MTTKTIRACDGCGKDLGTEQGLFYGAYFAGAFHANGKQQDWHACSAPCAAKHLQAQAAAIVKYQAKVDAERAKQEAENAVREKAAAAEREKNLGDRNAARAGTRVPA